MICSLGAGNACIAELYDYVREDNKNIISALEEPGILKETEKVTKEMKRGKDTGEDGIAVEMVRALDDFTFERIIGMANGYQSKW